MFTELKTLIAIKKYGSFSATGKEIGLTQAAISAQIKSLEQQLGIQLFDRIGRNAYLNSEGLRVINLAEEMMILTEKMKFSQSLAQYHGEIKVGAISTVQIDFIPSFLKKLVTYFPNARINLIPGVSDTLLQAVIDNSLDLAFMIKPPFPLDHSMEYSTLRKEEFILITHPSIEEKSIKEILEIQPFIRYNYKSFGGMLVQDFIHQNQFKTKDLIEVDEIEAIVKMVEDNLGVSIIPNVGLWKERAQLVKIFPLEPQSNFFREIIVVSKKAKHNVITNKIIRDILR